MCTATVLSAMEVPFDASADEDVLREVARAAIVTRRRTERLGHEDDMYVTRNACNLHSFYWFSCIAKHTPPFFRSPPV